MRTIRFSAVLLMVAPTGAFAEETPICTDRPTKANAVCTVPAGKFQLETSLAQWSRLDAGGSRTDIWQVGGSVLKYGVSDRSDLQLGFFPYVDIDSGSNRVDGAGDVTVRYKHRLTGENSKFQLAAIPFVKLPAARRGIGNGKLEGGLALPISTALGKTTLTLGPELDLLADSDRKGRHLQLVNLINIAAPVASRLTVVGELWTATNFDPADTVTLASADAALAYLVSNGVQLDFGSNFGLNRNAPDVEIYGGVSLRF